MLGGVSVGALASLRYFYAHRPPLDTPLMGPGATLPVGFGIPGGREAHMNSYQRCEDRLNETGLRKVGEAAPGDGFQDGNHDTASPRRTRPRPAWGLLYAVLPLTFLLFVLADVVPETSGWRSVTETMAVLVVFGALAAWVRSNRSALASSQDESETTSRR